jgi:DNA ligase D-like protein (predicted polymerase)
LRGLVALVQMDVVEIHPWGSTVKQLDNPDRLTFDLDPDESLPWQRVTEAAVYLHEALLGVGLKSFAKTTGGKGLHVVVPLAPKLGWTEVKAFAKWVADSFVAQRPEDFAVNMAKTARGAVFISIICATAEAQQQSAPIPPRPRRRSSLDPQKQHRPRGLHGRRRPGAAGQTCLRSVGGYWKTPPVTQYDGTTARRDLTMARLAPVFINC